MNYNSNLLNSEMKNNFIEEFFVFFCLIKCLLNNGRCSDLKS